MTPSSLPGFLAASGETGALIASLDWQATSLGPPQGWPAIIKSTLATWLDSPQPMCMAWGAELNFFYNTAYAPFLGARQAGAMGRPFSQVWSDVWADIQPIVAKALSGAGSRFEEMPLTMTRNGFAEPTWWTFTYMPLRDEAGAVVGMLCTTTDTTGKVLAGRQAGLERERQRLLLQQMPGFAGLLQGPMHVFDYVNDAYRSLSGPRDFLGRTVREVFPELQGQGFFELLDAVYRDGEPFVARAMPLRLAGKPGPNFIDLLYHPIRDDDGAVMGIFVGGYDVTGQVEAQVELRSFNETLEQRVEQRTAELLRTQDALRQAQKLEAVGQLTGGVAHDFNNLLTVIGSSVALMRRKALTEERRNHYMDAISETVRRAAKLTGQLLAFARRQPLSPEVFDVGSRLAMVIELVQPLVGARVAISLQTCERACFANADVNQFETALVNLAVNARDAMNDEGRITIRIAQVDGLPATRGHSQRAGHFVAISMTDTGPGVPAEQQEAIFEPFYTTKQVGKGTGLGLSQVFGFAQQSGGDIQVDSRNGSGATFTLYLPHADSPPAPADSAAPAGDAAPEHPRTACVLVVEDNESVGQFSTEMLRDLGYDTAWATDAASALEMLAREGARFDLVFSDVIMPGMNGVDLARTVRQRYPGLPVVLTSGYSTVLAEEGHHGFELIQKPYSVEALSTVIQRAITQRV